MTDEATRMRSHNRLGEPATRTREETVTRLQAKIVKNFKPIMPPFQGVVSEEQILQLIAYIRSLASVAPGSAAPATTSTAPSATPPQGVKH